MRSLRDIQIRCRQAFLAGNLDALAGQVLPHADAHDVGICVYQNNAKETFRQALAASFAIIAQLVGDACFAGLSAKYVEAHPSVDPDLQRFGEGFPDFLDRYYGASAHRYLADVARLELAAEQVLLEREVAPLNARILRSVPASAMPALRFIPSPGARLVPSEFPILDIWRMHYDEDSASVSLDAGPNYVLVVRESGNSVLRALTPEQFEIANRLFQGQSLGDAFESLHDYGNAARFQTALAGLLRYRLFSDINDSQWRPQ